MTDQYLADSQSRTAAVWAGSADRSRSADAPADSQKELQAFAQRLGLRREWFQPGEPLGVKPSPFWHYDVTAGERAQAIRLGPTPVTWRISAAGLSQPPASQAEPGPELS